MPFSFRVEVCSAGWMVGVADASEGGAFSATGSGLVGLGASTLAGSGLGASGLTASTGGAGAGSGFASTFGAGGGGGGGGVLWAGGVVGRPTGGGVGRVGGGVGRRVGAGGGVGSDMGRVPITNLSAFFFTAADWEYSASRADIIASSTFAVGLFSISKPLPVR